MNLSISLTINGVRRNVELEDPRVTLLIYENGNPYNYVEIRGKATSSTDGLPASWRNSL